MLRVKRGANSLVLRCEALNFYGEASTRSGKSWCFIHILIVRSELI